MNFSELERLSEKEHKLINQILDRSWDIEQIDLDYQQLRMDLHAVHVNNCQLDLVGLLNASKGDFIHDVAGIYCHIDRRNYKLLNGFLPRHSDNSDALMEKYGDKAFIQSRIDILVSAKGQHRDRYDNNEITFDQYKRMVENANKAISSARERLDELEQTA